MDDKAPDEVLEIKSVGPTRREIAALAATMSSIAREAPQTAKQWIEARRARAARRIQPNKYADLKPAEQKGTAGQRRAAKAAAQAECDMEASDESLVRSAEHLTKGEDYQLRILDEQE